jgi:protein TonB
MVEMVKFVPPVVKDDANEEEPQKLQEDVKDVNVGQKDQEGDKDLVAPPTETTGPTEPAQPEIFTIVEEQAEFPGGFAAMMKYIQTNVQYPAMAREAGISGKCFLKFVVSETGAISNVEVLKGVPGCPDCDKEAIRVVKSMPAWKPAKMTGRSVKCYFNLPVNFKIQ